MAPITEDTVEALRDTIHKLESRVRDLEGRLGNGSDGAIKNVGPVEAMRMVIMGPPGAGKRACSSEPIHRQLSWIRERNTST